MATRRWLGQATAVAQESRATPANVEIGDVFTLLVGGVSIATYTAAAATVADVTAGLTTAWNASTHPYATPVTASDQTTYLKLLADTAGVPFTVTSTAVNGGAADTQTLVITTPTANAGPNVWGTTTNWSASTVPVAGDTAVLENSSVDILWDLSQAGATLAELRIMQSYTGKIGLPVNTFQVTSSTVDASKPEYREDYLTIDSTLVNIGQHNGMGAPAGSQRIKLDLGAVASTVTVYNSATSGAETNAMPIRLVGSSITLLKVIKGNVGVATDNASETATVTTLDMGYDTAQAGDANVLFGPGVTWTTARKSGGTLVINSGGTTLTNSAGTTTVNAGNITTINCYDGTAEVFGSGTIGTLNAYGGTCYSNTSGTMTLANLRGGAVLDFTRSDTPRTVTQISPTGPATVRLDANVVTVTNKFTVGTTPTRLLITATEL